MKNTGFTLIEMVISLFLAAIVLTSVVISFQNFASFNAWIMQFSALQKHSVLDVMSFEKNFATTQKAVQIADIAFNIQSLFSREQNTPVFHFASLISDRNGGEQVTVAEKEGYLAIHQGFLFAGMVQVGNDLFISDTGNHVIRKIDLITKTSSVYAGAEGIAGNTNDTALLARFRNPTGLAYYNGVLYIVDTGNQVIRAVNTSTLAVTTFAGNLGQSGNAVGILKDSFFSYPTGIAINSTTGDIYLADTGNHCIKKLSNGFVSQILGESGFSGNTGTQVAAANFLSFRLNTPSSLAYNSNLQTLFINDFSNKRILKLKEGLSVATLTQDEYYGGLQSYQDTLGKEYLLYQNMATGSISSVELLDFSLSSILSSILSSVSVPAYLGSGLINQSFVRDNDTYFVWGINRTDSKWDISAIHADTGAVELWYGSGGVMGTLRSFDPTAHIFQPFADSVGDAKIEYLKYRQNILNEDTAPIEALFKFLYGDAGTDSAVELSYSSVISAAGD